MRGELGALVTRAFPTPAPCDRTQWDGLCSELGLMPEGALEEINAWAIERFGDPLLEDADGEVLIDPHRLPMRFGVVVNLATGSGRDAVGVTAGAATGDSYVGIEHIIGSNANDTKAKHGISR